MDSIDSKIIAVQIQENGIIRRTLDGYLIGRLNSDIDYKLLDEKESPNKGEQ